MTEILFFIFSILFTLFLPGFCLSYLFFSEKEIDVLERIALSIGLSLAVVPLIVFYGNIIGIRITQLSVIAEIIGLLLLTGGIVVFKKYKTRKL